MNKAQKKKDDVTAPSDQTTFGRRRKKRAKKEKKCKLALDDEVSFSDPHKRKKPTATVSQDFKSQNNSKKKDPLASHGILRKRRNKNAKTAEAVEAEESGEGESGKNEDNHKDTFPFETLHPVLRLFVRNTLKEGVSHLKDEFQVIKQYMPEGAAFDAFHANKSMNRYGDIMCLESTRVKLNKPGTQTPSGYIHANYVVSGIDKPFICASAPTDATILDFWHMIWQEDVSVIVMLCDLNENGREKCAQYWPPEANGMLKFGDYTICKTAPTAKKYLCDKKYLMVSSIELTKEGYAPRSLRHLHWPDWPDRSVPKDPRTAIKIRKNMLQSAESDKPILIHCSAGIGRTGTMAAINLGICQIEMPDKSGPIEGQALVKKIRDGRMHAVQTEIQYIFIHLALLEHIHLRYRVTLVPDYKQFKEDFEALLPKEE